MMIKAMTGLGESPAGRQILALTQADRIEDQPFSILDDRLELVSKHQRLCNASNMLVVEGASHSTEASPSGRKN